MTNLPTTITNMTFEELAQLTGQGEAPKPRLPRLFVNRDGIDEHENQIPVGTFGVNQGDEHAIYGKTVTLRPFLQTYQYQLYDANKQQMANRSIHVRNWNDEAIDELGTVRCGKIGKKNDTLTETQKEFNKRIKCCRFVFGTATMAGVNQKGEKEQIENVPVRMKLSGSNFMPFGDAVNLVNALKRPIFAFNFKLSLSRQKNGATTWYLIGVEPDLKNIITMSDADMELWREFNGIVEKENDFIVTKYRDAVKAKTKFDDLDDGRVLDLLGNDLNVMTAG